MNAIDHLRSMTLREFAKLFGTLLIGVGTIWVLFLIVWGFGL